MLAALVALLPCGGCATWPMRAFNSPPATLNAAEVSLPIAPAELDELTRAFADRYVGLLSSTCDALKDGNPDAVQRRQAQELMLNGATNVYDIASNADAFTRMLDLVVVTTLESQVWIDDDRATQVFGERADVLVRALHHGRVEAWALAAQVLRPDQLDLLDYLIWDWRRHNPDMVRASFVRFSNFAVGRGRLADAEVVAAGGFFPGISEAGRSIDEARLLSERMFYLLKRYPTLVRWQIAATKDELVSTPEVGGALADVHRLTNQVEQLPSNLATERKAIFAALDDRMRSADAALTKVRQALADANTTARTTGQMGQALDGMFKSAGLVFTRFDAWDRWSAGLPGHRPFDQREYTQGIKELAITAEKLNDLLKSSNNLLASSQWGHGMDRVNQSADARINLASEQGRQVVEAVFRRTCMAIVLFFAMLFLYRLGTHRLTRRGVNARAGQDGNGVKRTEKLIGPGGLAG